MQVKYETLSCLKAQTSADLLLHLHYGSEVAFDWIISRCILGRNSHYSRKTTHLSEGGADLLLCWVFLRGLAPQYTSVLKKRTFLCDSTHFQCECDILNLSDEVEKLGRNPSQRLKEFLPQSSASELRIRQRKSFHLVLWLGDWMLTTCICCVRIHVVFSACSRKRSNFYIRTYYNVNRNQKHTDTIFPYIPVSLYTPDQNLKTS